VSPPEPALVVLVLVVPAPPAPPCVPAVLALELDDEVLVAPTPLPPPRAWFVPGASTTPLHADARSALRRTSWWDWKLRPGMQRRMLRKDGSNP
jgi:hypothetical protein